MRALRLLAPLALALALLLLALHPVRFTHASFHKATCICPVCWINDGMAELSISEYC